MRRFKNILFYVDSIDDSTPSLLRAHKLAESNQASLTLVDVIEPVDTPEQIKSRYNLGLTALLKQQCEQFLQDLSNQLPKGNSPIATTVLSGLSFIEIIKYVEQGGFDLLIKVARPAAGIREKIFGSHDLHLLRKCPCPVLIDHPAATDKYQNILAAVDTASSSTVSCDQLVMDLATSLAQREQANLDVVHAWSLEGESVFRNGRFRVPEIELDSMLNHELEHQQNELQKLLSLYSISVDSENVHLVKGEPAEMINQIASLSEADIIVMGTVGRVGIPGFFIGNTAEEILQTTASSILAVKPAGFKSPVL